MRTFRDKVLQAVHSVPCGRVVSYGQVAAAIGHPRAARQVGQVLRSVDTESTVPWWRVVNSQGYLSIKGNWTATKELQQKLLEQEGVAVSPEFVVSLGVYQHQLKSFV